LQTDEEKAMLIQNRDRRLLAAITTYQRYRDRHDPVSRLKCAWGKMGHILWSLLSASDISREADIHFSVRLPHPTGVVIHGGAVVGPGCMIMQQVTLGQLAEGGAPFLDHNVYVGAGARILGAVKIGKGARIGANAVVLTDLPEGATAVGIPARIVRQKMD
jgi:serine O-acetyltransferase